MNRLKRPFVDFGAVRERARFDAVLQHFGLGLEGTGIERFVLCPFHRERNASMHVNLDKKVFFCFGCEAKGDVIDFVAKIEAVGAAQAASRVAEICGIAALEADGEGRESGRSARRARSANETSGQARNASERERDGNGSNLRRVNPPPTLTLNPGHPYLVKRNTTAEVIKAFGLGYCTTGFMKGRICIPIHDERGQLAAYAGRWAADDIPPNTPRYLLPRGFRKSDVLFNLHRVLGKATHLTIVEGYWSVFRLHALNVPAVALMGRTLSDRQEVLLGQSGAHMMTLLLDGDVPGRDATAKILPRLAGRFFTRTPTLPESEAPDTLSDELLGKLYECAIEQ